jgi:hypothetical protein
MTRAHPAEAIASSSGNDSQTTETSRNSAGKVAVSAPRAHNIIIRPLSSGTRSLGNQSTRAFKPAVNDAATPRPISARPPTSSQKLSERANKAAPTAAATITALWICPGPYRSNKIPIRNLGRRERQIINRGQQAKMASAEAKFRRQSAGDRRIDGPEQKREVVSSNERQEHAQNQTPISRQASDTSARSLTAMQSRRSRCVDSLPPRKRLIARVFLPSLES